MAKGKRGNKKQAKWKRDPGPVSKTPRGTDKAEQYNAAKFCWRSDWIDLDGEWGFRGVDCEALWNEVIPRLHDLETMTWGEIYGKRDGSTHPMPAENIETEAQDRLKAIGREQYETLFQINVRGGCRLWGVRDRTIFFLMWYDPNHTVYKQK